VEVDLKMDSIDTRRLAQSELSLKGILDASPVGIIVFDADARVIFSNPLAERLFGKSLYEPHNLKCGDFIGCAHRHTHPQGCGNTRTCATCPLYCGIRSLFKDVPDPDALEGEALITRESDLPAIWVKFKVSGIALDSVKAVVMAIDDITSQKLNEEKLRNALTELSVIHEHAPIAMMLMDPQRRVRKVNGFAARFARRAAHEMIGMAGGEALRCLHHLDDPQGCGFGPACADCRVRQAVVQTFETRTSQTEVEAWLPFPKGESHEQRCLLISTAYLKTDVIERVLVCAQDITERKLAENERKVVLQLLSRLNEPGALPVLIRQVTALIKEWSGCDAVGIRLQDGEDYPYYETHGFPADFVKAENRLCATDPTGASIRDSQGNAVLECMCGNVIRGRFDPAQPFFTAYGSFWTNSTTDLLASTDEADRQSRTRNRCHGEGYESVALIPLRYEGRNLGLLQFNDPRRDRFSAAKITLLERVASNLSIGIAQRLTAEALARNEEQLRTIADFTYDWEYWTGPDRRLIWISPSCQRMTGYTAAEFIADEKLLEQIIHKADALPFLQHHTAMSCDENQMGHLDFRIIHKSGRTVWIDHHCTAIRRPDGTPLGRRVSNRDITDRKRMEEALLEREAMQRALVEGIPDIVVRFDSDCRQLFVSRSIETLTDIPASQFIGKTHRELGFPRSLCDVLESCIQRVFAGSEAFETEFSTKGKTGQITFNWRLVPERDPEGKVNSVLSIARDVTAHRKAEKDYQTLFRELLDGFAVHEILCDADGQPVDYRFLAVNPAFERLTGLNAEAIRNKTALEVIPDLERHWIETYGRVALTGEPAFFENHAKDLDKHFEVTAFRPLPGQFACIFKDITDRKRMEQMLQESEAQFRTLVEGAPDAIFVQDPTCRFVYLNEAALRLFGAHTADQLLGTTILDRFHPDFHQAVRERIRTLYKENKKMPRRERVCLRLDGSAVPVEVSAVPITVRGERRCLVFVQDISERKQIEVRLQQAQKLEAIGTLAGGIAHDFNNILFPISGMSEMLLEDLEPGSLHYENVALIHNAAVRAKGLVAQILSFSRQAEHKKIPLQIQHVLKEVGKLARATIPSNIVIRQNIQYDCGPVMADPTNMHQIAMNLITNALHAVELKGGTIGIELERTVVTQDDTPGTSLVPGPYALLTVSDTGHGIEAEVLPRIFDPYFTTKRQDKGTGLGLAVVYGIVKEHDGDIRVYSEVGQGTTVKVYLPLMRPGKGSPGNLEVVPEYPTGTERVLLVDDEEPILRIERQILERQGYRVTTHTSCLQALQAFEADPAAWDLVITDMAMPDMTGDQLARRLVEVRPDIPVILCTGFSEKVFITDDAASAIKGFLMKPVAKGDLARMVRKILDKGAGG
jgi:PAS domain S-box-containing protein